MKIDGVDEAIPSRLTSFQSYIARFYKNHIPYSFALANKPELFDDLEVFKVYFGSVSKCVDYLLTHDTFIGLGNNSN